MAAPSPRASLGRRTVCGRTEQRRPPVSKRYETQVGSVSASFLIAAAALKTPTRNGYTAQGVNLTFCEAPLKSGRALVVLSISYPTLKRLNATGRSCFGLTLILLICLLPPRLVAASQNHLSVSEGREPGRETPPLRLYCHTLYTIGDGNTTGWGRP